MSAGGLRWWSQGIRFECQGSGRCCVSRGSFGYVYLTLEDRRRLARFLGLATGRFTRLHCAKTEGHFHLAEEHGRGECRFLKDCRCEVYEGRPTQCRTWPFWPEMMRPKIWAREVLGFCPGVGRGPHRSEREIERILAIQRRADERY